MAQRTTSTSAALPELARQVRGKTLEMLRTTPETWLTWSPPGTSNHILWHAGHALWAKDVLCVGPLAGKSELPDGWADTFGQRCQPVATTTEWPRAQEVGGHLEAQLERILELLAEHAERIVDRGHEVSPSCGWPLLAGIVHGWHDEARHQGEMYLLQKLCRAGTLR
jgi:DinB superfamily